MNSMKSLLSTDVLLSMIVVVTAMSIVESAPAENSDTSLARSKRFFIDAGRCSFKILCIHPSQCDQEAGELCMIWYCGSHCAVPEVDPADVPVFDPTLDHPCTNWHNPDCRDDLRELRQREKEERQRARQERRRARQERRG
ncbi:uncharacterized protein [Watersipora subatra]|uniref:uncharacterized protein n=1 Tax=Watersipora subatra TaxID=2589382 RepID=UPI00355B8FA2